MTRDFFTVFHPLHGKLLLTCCTQRSCDRMIGIPFRQCRKLQDFRLISLIYNDLVHGKFSPRQSTCFIKNDRLHLRQDFQIIASFDQHALSGGSADPAEESERHGDYKSTRAGNNQKNAGPLQPFCKRLSEQKGRKYRQQHCGTYYHRCIIFRKSGDKILYFRLLAARIFHKLKDLGNSRIVKLFCDLYF